MDLEDLGESETIQWFTNLNVLPIIQISELIYPRLVRIFYNNLYINKNDKLSIYILGYYIPIKDNIIYDILGIT